MSCLAIIPAKSKSRRLPNKNFLKIENETLWERALRCAKKAEIFDGYAVSSDGVTDYLPRPQILCDDQVQTAAVVFDVLAQVSYMYDSFCVLNPSSPCRTPEMLKDAYKEFTELQVDCFYSTDGRHHHNGDFLFWQTLPFLRYISRNIIPYSGSFPSVSGDFTYAGKLTDGIDVNTLEDFESAERAIQRR